MNEGITASLLGHHKNNRPCILPQNGQIGVCPIFGNDAQKIDSGKDSLLSISPTASSTCPSHLSTCILESRTQLHHHPPVMAHGGKVGNMGILIDSLITSDLSRELVNTVVSELQTVQLTGTSIVTTSQFSAWVFREDVGVVLTAAKIAHAMAKMRVLEDANQDEKEVKENIDDDSDAEDENEDSEDDENFAAAPYYWPLSHSFDTAAPPTTLDAIRNELMNEYSAATTPRVDLSELAIGIDSVSRDITKSGHSAKTRKTLITAGLSDVCASVIRSNKIGLMVETGAIVIALSNSDGRRQFDCQTGNGRPEAGQEREGHQRETSRQEDAEEGRRQRLQKNHNDRTVIEVDAKIKGMDLNLKHSTYIKLIQTVLHVVNFVIQQIGSTIIALERIIHFGGDDRQSPAATLDFPIVDGHFVDICDGFNLICLAQVGEFQLFVIRSFVEELANFFIVFNVPEMPALVVPDDLINISLELEAPTEVQMLAPYFDVTMQAPEILIPQSAYNATHFLCVKVGELAMKTALDQKMYKIDKSAVINPHQLGAVLKDAQQGLSDLAGEGKEEILIIDQYNLHIILSQFSIYIGSGASIVLGQTSFFSDTASESVESIRAQTVGVRTKNLDHCFPAISDIQNRVTLTPSKAQSQPAPTPYSLSWVDLRADVENEMALKLNCTDIRLAFGVINAVLELVELLQPQRCGCPIRKDNPLCTKQDQLPAGLLRRDTVRPTERSRKVSLQLMDSSIQMTPSSGSKRKDKLISSTGCSPRLTPERDLVFYFEDFAIQPICIVATINLMQGS
ncbi:hypothetical protein BLNAU_24371 [Blattamonas nauphoetae]|uniref:Uncharacterized protein n=1 Tax=Blattamonas nauphoetae TaxID=2049346 RepID=A0ABQ9WMZ7_9EUKA|nr:hypothetical protein BLNAU_24371 [Blattamonas nauphoetae]